MICPGFGSHAWTFWIGRAGEVHLNSGAGHCGRDSSFGLKEVTPIWTLLIGAVEESFAGHNFGLQFS